MSAPRSKPATGPWITEAEYKARRWYEIGTRWETCPTFLYVADMDGHRREYLAGCYARLFGVSLSPVC